MKSVLTDALERLPKYKTVADIKFYWRIILERFLGNEKVICASLNQLEYEHPRTQRLYTVLIGMRELSARTAIHLWDKVSHDGSLPLIEVRDRKFIELDTPAQIKLLEDCLETGIEDYAVCSLLSRIKAEGSIQAVAKYLRARDSEKDMKHVRAFLMVVKYMLLEPVRVE